MTQYVIIKKDDLESETTLEAAENVWVPVMGWEIVGEPTEGPTRDPWASVVAAEAEATAAAAPADEVQAPGESKQEPGAPS